MTRHPPVSAGRPAYTLIRQRVFIHDKGQVAIAGFGEQHPQGSADSAVARDQNGSASERIPLAAMDKVLPEVKIHLR